jgi:hypothetical protein
MSEETLPKPFPEARPPHLPDVLTRQSPWMLVFLLVAAVVAWRSWISWGPSAAGEEVSSFISFVTFASSILAPPLFGAAVFARHRNARTTMPMLVFGLGLMAFGVVLTVFGEQIRDVVRGTGGFTEFQTPGETAFLVFKELVALFGVLYVAAGLASTRTAPKSRGERPVAIWLTALTVVSIVLSLRAMADLLSAGDYPPGLLVQVAIGFVLSIASSLGWLYFTVTVVGGWLAGETPNRAWLAAAIGVLLLFVSPLVVSVALVLDTTGSPFLQVFNYATLAAWVLLVVAFALGLPSPPVTAEPVEPTGDRQGATQPGS